MQLTTDHFQVAITSYTRRSKRKSGIVNFSFALETSMCFNYITEKLASALEAGPIPIVHGWEKSYEQRLSRSFIHVADVESLSDLANHLEYLSHNENKFMQYHKWRLKYQVEKMHLQPICRLCHKLKKFSLNPRKSTVI